MKVVVLVPPGAGSVIVAGRRQVAFQEVVVLRTSERLGGDAEVACAGFWPGSDRYPRPAFYAYTYPKPDGIEKQAIDPAEAGWSTEIGEFALPYDDVRTSASPREAILQFFESTYEAGARLGRWDQSLVAR